MRHQVLQLVVTYTCGIAQLSPGAYLLRRDLFTSIVQVSKLLSYIQGLTRREAREIPRY